MFHKDSLKFWTKKYLAKLPLRDQAAIVRTCRDLWMAGQPNLSIEKIKRLHKRRCYFLIRAEISKLESVKAGFTPIQAYFSDSFACLSSITKFYERLLPHIELALTFKDYYQVITSINKYLHNREGKDKLGYAVICILQEAMKVIFHEEYLHACHYLRDEIEDVNRRYEVCNHYLKSPDRECFVSSKKVAEITALINEQSIRRLSDQKILGSTRYYDIDEFNV